MLNAITARATQAALAEDAGRQMRQGVVLEFGDDLLDDRVVTMPLVGLDHGEGAVGDEGVVAVGREQLALLGAIASQPLEPVDPAHDKPAGHVLGLAAAGERGERTRRPPRQRPSVALFPPRSRGGT